MLGSVNLLIDTEDEDSYQEIYCNTLQTIREIIVEGTLSGATGVESTAMFGDNLAVSNIDCPAPTSRIGNGSVSLESSSQGSSDGKSSTNKGVIYGAAVCGVVLLGIVASQKRRRSERSYDGVWISGSESSTSRYNLSVSTTSEVNPWYQPRSMEAA